MYCIDGAFFMFHYLVIFSLGALCFSFAQLPMPTTADCSTAISISCGDSLRINTSNYPIAFVDNCLRGFTKIVWFSFVGDSEVYDFTYSTTLNDEAGNVVGHYLQLYYLENAMIFYVWDHLFPVVVLDRLRLWQISNIT